jgi:2-iminobutanoate/2-iminopropanoate deaminase
MRNGKLGFRQAFKPVAILLHCSIKPIAMKKYLLLPLLLITASSFAQQTPIMQEMPVTFKNPKALSLPKGYSQAAEVDMGSSRMIIMAGQIALDKNGTLIGKDNLAKQTEQCFINIKHIVEDAGGNMNNIVKLNYYIKNVKQVQQVRNIRDKYINTKTPPVSTLVEVSKLFRDDILIEIEATAVILNKKKKG